MEGQCHDMEGCCQFMSNDHTCLPLPLLVINVTSTWLRVEVRGRGRWLWSKDEEKLTQKKTHTKSDSTTWSLITVTYFRWMLPVQHIHFTGAKAVHSKSSSLPPLLNNGWWLSLVLSISFHFNCGFWLWLSPWLRPLSFGRSPTWNGIRRHQLQPRNGPSSNLQQARAFWWVLFTPRSHYGSGPGSCSQSLHTPMTLNAFVEVTINATAEQLL